MIGIETKSRLVKARAANEKSIAALRPAPARHPQILVTYSRENFKLDSIAAVAPLARKKPATIGDSVDYMAYIRAKPHDENIVVSLAKPRKLVSVPADSVESLVVKGVSVPLKSYSSSGLTRLASGFLGGFDVLMSQSLSAFFGLIVNASVAYVNYRKKGAPREYFHGLIALLGLQTAFTLLVAVIVGFLTSLRYVAGAALLCTAFFFIANSAFKSFHKHRDLLTALHIDELIASDLYLRKRTELESQTDQLQDNC